MNGNTVSEASVPQRLLTIWYMHELSDSYLDPKKQVDIAVIDFSKTFAKVSHTHKLDYYGIRGSTLAWINYFCQTVHNRLSLRGLLLEP